jgi:chromosome segregation ATPase
MRSLAKEEEDKLSTTYTSFQSDVKNLKDFTEAVDHYIASGNEKDLGQVSSKAEAIKEKMNEKRAEIGNIQPDLDNLDKAVKDQERHKLNLEENIDIIKTDQRILELENEICKFEEELGKVEGHDTYDGDCQRIDKKKQELLFSKARLEGRRGEIVESTRNLKVCSVVDLSIEGCVYVLLTLFNPCHFAAEIITA